MLSRLEKVSTVLQIEQGLADAKFEDVLKKVLKKIDKQSPDLQQKFETLRANFYTDRTTTKVHFLQKLMLILGVPENHVSIPFHK